MILKNIKLVNFRNYECLDVSLNPGINIIYGNNAQGKTNFLESIYVLAFTKSHRCLNDCCLIRNGFDFFTIDGVCCNDNINTSYSISLTKNKKILKIDNDIIKSVSNYISKFRVILFIPDDLELIKGNPSLRRRYLNMEISQIDNNYYKILLEYTKLLKIRNELLKNNLKGIPFDENYFEIITDYLIDKEIIIYRMRKKFIDRINDYSEEIFKNISKLSDFHIEYVPNIKIDNNNQIKEIIKNKYFNIKEVEKRAGITILGPHRDDLQFMLGNTNLKEYGSQGQQRMAILTIKLSEIEIYNQYMIDKPLLLLDDVFSELDFDKKNNLLKYIKNNIQTIITTTDLSNLDKSILDNSKLIHINDGKIIN